MKSGGDRLGAYGLDWAAER